MNVDTGASKGISPLIAAVLLTAFTMAIASLAGPFFIDVLESPQESSNQQSKDLVDASKNSIDIRSTSYDSSSDTTNVVFQNSGSEKLEGFTIVVYGKEISQKTVEQNLAPGEISSVDISSSNPSKIEIDSKELPVKATEDITARSSETIKAYSTYSNEFNQFKSTAWMHGASESFGLSSSPSLKWNKSDLRVYNPPTVANGTVFVGGIGSQYLYAYNISTGQTKWSDIGQTFDGIVAGASSPTVYNGKVFVGTDKYDVRAYNASNGNKIWESPLDNYDYSVSSLVFRDGLLYLTSNFGNIYSFNASNGDRKFKHNMSSLWTQGPAYGQEKLYIAYNQTNISGVIGFDTSSESRVWNYSGTGVLRSSVTYKSGKVYFGTKKGKFHVLNASDGSEIINKSVSGPITSTPVVNDGKIFFGSLDSNFYALDEETGNQVWNFTTGDEIGSSPLVVDQSVYFGSTDNRTYALDKDNGDEIWSYENPDSASTPVVADGKMFVGSYSTPFEPSKYYFNALE